MLSRFQMLQVFIVLSLVCAIHSQNNYEFYVNNSYNGSPMNGSFEFPYQNLSQSFALITNTTDLSLTYYLTPTSEIYLITLGSLIPTSLNLQRCSNCSSSQNSSDPSVNMDISLNTTTFSLSMTSLMIVDGVDQNQTIKVNGTSLMINMSKISINTIQPIVIEFDAESLEGTFSDLVYNVSNLKQPFISINTQYDAVIKILNLNCTQFDAEIFSISSSSLNEKSSLVFMNATFMSLQNKSTTSKLPLFEIYNISTINISDHNIQAQTNLTYFEIYGDFQNLNIESINFTNVNSSGLIWMSIQNSSSNPESYISIDSISLFQSIIQGIVVLDNSNNSKSGINITNVNILSSNLTFCFNFTFSEAFLLKDPIYLNFENFNIMQTSFVSILGYQYNQLSPNIYYANFKDIFVQNCYFFSGAGDTVFSIFYVNTSYITVFNMTLVANFVYSTVIFQDYASLGYTKFIKLNFSNTTIGSGTTLFSSEEIYDTDTPYEKIISFSESFFINVAGYTNYSPAYFIRSFATLFEFSNNIFSNIILSDYGMMNFVQNYEVTSTKQKIASNITGNIFNNINIEGIFFLSFNTLNTVPVNIEKNVYVDIECYAMFYNFNSEVGVALNIQNEITVNGEFLNYVFAESQVININFVSNVGYLSNFENYLAAYASTQNTMNPVYITTMMFSSILTRNLFYFADFNTFEALQLNGFVGNNITLDQHIPESNIFFFDECYSMVSIFENFLITGVYFKTNTKLSIVPKLNLIHQNQMNSNLLFQNFVLKDVFLGQNLTNLIILNHAYKLQILNFNFENIFLFNTYGYPIEISAAILEISGFTLTNPIIEIYQIYTGDRGFIQNNFVINDKTQVTISDIYIYNWTLDAPFITLRDPTINLQASNINSYNSTQIFSIASNGGQLVLSDIYINSSRAPFMETIYSSSSSSSIQVNNFFQENSYPINFYQFEINWANLDLSFKNITLINSCLVNSILSNGSITIDQFIIKGNYFSSSFQVQFEPMLNASILAQIKDGVVQNVTGDYLVNITTTSQSPLVRISNIIFDEANMSLYSTNNSNIELSNFIQARSYPAHPILDSSINSHCSTQGKFVTFSQVYNSKNFMTFKNKSISFSSLELISSSPMMIENSNFSLEESSFQYNVNPASQGGCVSLKNSSLNVTNSSFGYNIALIGGIFYQDSGSFSIENPSTIENTAILYGNTWASQPWKLELKKKEIKKQSPLFDEYERVEVQKVSSGYQYSHYSISNASSAFALNKLLEIRLLDNFNNSIQFDQNMMITLHISNPNSDQSNFLVTSNANIESAYEFIASNITMPPVFSNETIQINVTYNNFTMTLILDIESRGCLIGEEFDELQLSCEVCPQDYFSLVVNQTCQDCPEGAKCPGGRFIHAKKGYWREPNTSNIYQCMNDSVPRCQGSIDPHRQCLEGYSGGLCLGCNYTAFYSEDSAHICSSCSGSLFWLAFNSAGALLLSFAYELGMLFLTYRSNKKYLKNQETNEHDFELSCLLLVMNTFLQIGFILTSYIWNIETSFFVVIDKLQFLLSIASIQPQNISNFPCLLLRLGVDPADVTYIQVVMQAVLPFAKMILLIVILLLRNWRRKVNLLGAKIIWIIVVFISLDQTGILLFLGKFSQCIIGDLEGYSLLDPNIKCSSLRYNNFLSEFVYPAIIFWGVLVPIVFCLFFYQQRNRLQEEKVRRILGSLMNNFTDETYYWNLVIMFLKMSIIIILIFFDPNNASNFCMCLTIAYFYFLASKKPLRERSLNKLHEKSTLAIFLTTYFFNQATGNTDQRMIAFYVILIMLVYTVVSAYLIFKISQTVLHKYCKRRVKKDTKILSSDITPIDDEASSQGNGLEESLKENNCN